MVLSAKKADKESFSDNSDYTIFGLWHFQSSPDANECPCRTSCFAVHTEYEIWICV